MSHDQSTSERVYGQLKAAVLDGSLGDSVRLDFAELALRLGVSTTPVREAAMRLQGEGLVELPAKGGARPLRLSEFRLRALLNANEAISLASLGRKHRTAIPEPVTPESDAGLTNEQRARAIYRKIALHSGNPEIIEIVERLNDRLMPYRLHEDRVLGDCRREYEALEAAEVNVAMLRRLVRAYHRRRLAKVARLMWTATMREEK